MLKNVNQVKYTRYTTYTIFLFQKAIFFSRGNVVLFLLQV